MREVIVISGPVRSGKSTFAEKKASEIAALEDGEGLGGGVAYIATAQAFDKEMKARIELHQQQRPKEWETFEAPFNPAGAIKEAYAKGYRVFLLDCLTMYISNWLYRLMPEPDPQQIVAPEIQETIEREVEGLLKSLEELPEGQCIIVTNEVGWGLVPDYPLGRFYRDLCGRCNRILAQGATQVDLIVMGLPLRLK